MSTESSIHLGVVVAALVAVGYAFGVQAPRSAPVAEATHVEPLALIPSGSAFLLTADVPQLQRSEVGALLAQRIGRATGKLATLCGFDPLRRLNQLAIAVPSAGSANGPEHPEDFAIVASGQFTAEEIVRCASASIRERGGDPATSELGHFESVRDRKGGAGEVAVKDGGPLIVSGGSYFRALLDAAEGRPAHTEPAPTDAWHAELRRTLGPAPLIATWLLGDGWLERVAGEGADARLSALSGLRSVGARVDVGHEARLELLLDCSDSDSATRVSSLLGELRGSLGALPLDPALSSAARRIVVSQVGARLKLGLTASPAELGALLDLLLGPA